MSATPDPQAALLSAILEGDADALATALAAGADPNRQDASGWSALTWAAGAGARDKVALLLRAGADPFVFGDDGRTPYLVAVAAGRAEVAQLLAEAEERAGGDEAQRSSRRHETRPYCRAYHAHEFRRFPGWREAPLTCPEPRPSHIDADLLGPITDEDILFLHRSLRVTRSVFEDELVVFDGSSPGWAAFCAETLGFRPMDDRDWMALEEGG